MTCSVSRSRLIAPAVALIPFAAVTAAAAVAVLGTRAIAPAAILALPTVLAGAAGGVVSIVRDAPDPTRNTQQAFVPPDSAARTLAGTPLLPTKCKARSHSASRYTERDGSSC